jgi:sulfate/thiosulfate-binding protein
MKMTIKAAVIGVTGVLALAGCTSAGGASNDDAKTLNIVGFSVLETANKAEFSAFQDTSAGKDVEFAPSYGASGDQSRAVEAGADADVVHFSLETDMTRLVDDGLVADDWNAGPTKGIATSSVIAFVVRKGNPKNITSWDDLIKPGVSVVAANPGSSGAARWSMLGAWEHVVGAGGSDDDAKQFISQLLSNTPVLPASGRDATSAFLEGDQDVLITYENEAILAKQSGSDIDYVLPQDNLLIENPAAVTKDAPQAASDFLGFMESAQGQEIYAKYGFRPVAGIDGVTIPDVEGANDPSDPFPAPPTLYTIEKDFGGWSKAADQFFADGEDGEPVGIITDLIAKSGSDAQED